MKKLRLTVVAIMLTVSGFAQKGIENIDFLGFPVPIESEKLPYYDEKLDSKDDDYGVVIGRLEDISFVVGRFLYENVDFLMVSQHGYIILVLPSDVVDSEVGAKVYLKRPFSHKRFRYDKDIIK